MVCLTNLMKTQTTEAIQSVATHIGTFNGSTTFTTSSRNGINPGLFIEVMDDEGNLTQYESEDGVITIPNTQEGAYITQAKLLGKTKYVDEDTGEVLNAWEEGRNLKLESSENPILTAMGKNFFYLGEDDLKGYIYDASNNTFTSFPDGRKWIDTPSMELPGPQTYTISFNVIKTNTTSANSRIEYAFSDNTSPSGIIPTNNNLGVQTITFSIDEDSEFKIKFVDGDTVIKNLQIERGSIATTYEPHTLNTIFLSEDVVLRGIDDIQDTLDLMTGEVLKRVGEINITGNENWVLDLQAPVERFRLAIANCKTEQVRNPIISNKYKSNIIHHSKPNAHDTQRAFTFGGNLYIYPPKEEIKTVKQFKELIMQEKPTFQYELQAPLVKTIKMMSDYFFKPINKDSIEVNGTILPLMASITVPTDSLSFTLDPNQAAGQQFIAPDFTLRNETLAPLRLELKAFEQVTDVLNDVLPATHSDWDQLNTQQSKDIALALVPKPSDQWLSLIEGPRYAANTSNDLIGTIKGQSTVEFSFEALHGRAFSEVLAPRYRLTFIFEVN